MKTGETEELTSASEQVLKFYPNCGVIGLMKDRKRSIPTDTNEYIQAVARFPDREGVIMKSVTLTKVDLSAKEFFAAINIPDNVPIKAAIFILFETSGPHTDVTPYYKMLKKRDNNVAIAGSRIDWPKDYENLQPINIITFAGENVLAASAAIMNYSCSEAGYHSNVRDLRIRVGPTDNSVIFNFRYYAPRLLNKNRAKRDKWETDALKKYFPTVPVVGCYGWCDMGSLVEPVLNNPDPEDEFEIADVTSEYSTLLFIAFK